VPIFLIEILIYYFYERSSFSRCKHDFLIS